MTASVIVADLGRRGIRLYVEGDRLAFDAPRGVLTGDDLALLRAHEAGVIAHLVESESPAWEELAALLQDEDPTPGIVTDRPPPAPDPGRAAPPDAPTPEPMSWTADDAPAWVFDDSLAVRSADVRAAAEEARNSSTNRKPPGRQR